MNLEKVQEKVQLVTNYTAPTGGGMSIFGFVTLNEALAIGGFVLALGSFAINWYYQHKRYELEKDRHTK